MTVTALPASATIPEPMMLRPFRVTRRRLETSDTVTIALAADDDGAPLRFSPGQFTMVYAHGVGEVPLSISGDPDAPEMLVHTVRAVGAVTDAICATPEGGVLGIRGPYGTTWPLERMHGRDVIVIAGGIGLAPVRPAIHRLLANREQFGTVSIVYGSRTPSDLLYTDDVAAWRSRFDTNVQVTVDRGDDDWQGDVGVVTPMLNRLTFDPEATSAIVCGPEIMMRVVAKELVGRGVSPTAVHVSMERNMKCGIGLCGHCQLGRSFVCKDGPVFAYADVARRMGMEEL